MFVFIFVRPSRERVVGAGAGAGTGAEVCAGGRSRWHVGMVLGGRVRVQIPLLACVSVVSAAFVVVVVVVVVVRVRGIISAVLIVVVVVVVVAGGSQVDAAEGAVVADSEPLQEAVAVEYVSARVDLYDLVAVDEHFLRYGALVVEGLDDVLVGGVAAVAADVGRLEATRLAFGEGVAAAADGDVERGDDGGA